MKNLTPAHMRCDWQHCPIVVDLGGRSLLIISAAGYIDEWNTCLGMPIGPGETAVIADKELLDDYVRARAAELGWSPPDGK